VVAHDALIPATRVRVNRALCGDRHERIVGGCLRHNQRGPAAARGVGRGLADRSDRDARPVDAGLCDMLGKRMRGAG
jgi:hypothetical protein